MRLNSARLPLVLCGSAHSCDLPVDLCVPWHFLCDASRRFRIGTFVGHSCLINFFETRRLGFLGRDRFATGFRALAVVVVDLPTLRLDPPLASSPSRALALVWGLCGPVWTTFFVVRRVRRVFGR